MERTDSFVRSTRGLHEIHRFARHSIYVGEGAQGWLWAGAQRSTLVLGPPRSGKTSSLVIPNILVSDGPVVSTSTKPDVMRATASSRSNEGWTFLYDPSGEVECPAGVERVGWSPLTAAKSWDAAVVTADAMVGATRLNGPRSGEHHWTERASALLSTLMHAAALGEYPMRDVLRWIDRHDGSPALELLDSHPGHDEAATDLLSGIVATDPREQSGIWSTASGVLAAYRTASAMASTTIPPLDVETFCSGPNTLYLCSAGRRQRQFAPLVVATIGDVRDATYTRALNGNEGPPTLLALDEVANIAPVPDLPSMVSEGAGQGLLVLACLQDLSQARARWGQAADGFLSLFGTTVVLPGIADTATLRDLSALAGDREIISTTISRSVDQWGRIRPSTSVSPSRERRLPVDAVSRGVRGHALVLGPDKDVTDVTLTPAHERSPWRELVGRARVRDAVEREAPGLGR
ncbi:MAG TPA: type IV secretory system conjugative DNA transfer family protein [Acidimicrobiales bacterium]|nr:type IV secretory system conjugative DNA transfer family protein [Acidimicrobiales bacterium]